MYLNKHIIFCETVAKPRLVPLKLHGLITSVVQQIADAFDFLCLEYSYIPGKHSLLQIICCVPAQAQRNKGAGASHG